ncbi:RNA polymerase sigma factor [Algisphaera agarilytica]|uniref:RNA polymerase sigma-70 factor (ECF subfamily) n=1 Tax=Algisphaera agarilytica TaxID=1385975 RepID=A0A7X0H9K1_9BACT|nr:RNA polymerase sigma factor [Algisphaera agarilytica]MBB6430299.1 RNA polymerase sigma-70 factor (ECF subfamily) [Algisphaera agarilytica]
MTPREQKAQAQTFDRWLAEHRGILFKVVRAYAFTIHDQDDLYQEICAQLWRSVPKFQHASSETTWIYRVSLYTAMRWSKTQKKHRSQPLAGHEPVLTPLDQPDDQRLAWLYQQIAKLNEVDRSVTLMMFDGIPYAEIAEALGISESNVGVKVHRIKQRLTRAAEEGGIS